MVRGEGCYAVGADLESMGKCEHVRAYENSTRPSGQSKRNR